MPKSEAQKRATARWDGKNMTLVSTKIKRETAEEYKAWCRAHGTNPSAEIAALIRRSLSAEPAQASATAPAEPAAGAGAEGEPEAPATPAEDPAASTGPAPVQAG